jgi:8-oxo-dGTP diphosphatase
VWEEAGIDLREAGEVRFVGLVTWPTSNTATVRTGMYAFLAWLPPDYPLWPDRSTEEGLLSWKALEWVCDSSNEQAVSNIPQFLPRMLSEQEPGEYYCFEREGRLVVARLKDKEVYPPMRDSPKW